MTEQRRVLCPGELRFRAFAAGPGKREMWVAGPASGLIAGAMTGIRVGPIPGIAVGVVLAAGVTIVELARRPPIEKNAKVVPVTIEVTPWGVVSGGSRFPWSALLSIEELTRSVKRGDETVTVYVLYVEVARRTYLQAQSDSLDAPALAALFARFATATRRKLAIGLHGEEPVMGSGEGIADKILEGARRVVAAGEPAGWFRREGGKDYRTASGFELVPEAAEALVRTLTEEPSGAVDPAPLHAAILAECGFTPAVEPLLGLTMSPNPIVAASARAAALRLGASPVRTGPIDEIGEYLPFRERAAWSAWASEAQPVAKSPTSPGR